MGDRAAEGAVNLILDYFEFGNFRTGALNGYESASRLEDFGC
jgi:hypothetical protein